MPRAAVSCYPDSFPKSSDEPSLRYVRREDCFAIEGAVPADLARSVLYALPSEQLTVVNGNPEERLKMRVRAVYSFTPTEPPAVPTGRVWVRSVGGRVGDAELAAVGYSVETAPDHAPDAVWVRAADGSVQAALAGLERLAGIDGVVLVEAEMLRPRSRRAAPPTRR